MNDTDRFKLLFGPYQTPRCRYGRTVTCLLRGRVKVCGLTEAPIPWPIGKQGRTKAMILYKDLARAVRREAAQAIGHWWDVGSETVWRWKKALGVGLATEGTRRLHRDYSVESAIVAGLAKAQAKAGDPERRAKIAAAKRGKPRPPHVGQAVAKAHRGTHHTEEARRKMSKSQRRRRARDS